MPDTAVHSLGGGISIYTDGVHKFGTDAVLLADFASAAEDDTACDLGTGCGIIPLLWCIKAPPKLITAIDIQPEATELMRRSAELNGLSDRLDIRCADLREPDPTLSGKYTLVTMNPPYKRADDGVISPDRARAIARHELTCTVNDLAKCAARLLKPSGRLCVCHRPERLCDLLCAMREAGIEPKRLRFICQRADSSPMLVLCEGRRGGAGGMVIDPPFIVESADGGYSEQMKAVYSMFEGEKFER